MLWVSEYRLPSIICMLLRASLLNPLAIIPAVNSSNPNLRGLTNFCTHLLTFRAGRWTKEEHELFIQGLLMYKKNWKKLKEHIKTRTSAQIRTHAQKYFEKLNRHSAKRALAQNAPAGGFVDPVSFLLLSSTRSYSLCAGV